MKELEFKISSGLKNIIGKELITDDFIAIFELVKNSYDANAKNVKIIFQNINNSNARILIIDDGEGMSYNDLVNKFLFVGYSDKNQLIEEQKKKNFRDKIQKHRIYAGAKGIGRFSCDRLGAKLNLITKRKNEDKIHNLIIEWTKFEEDQNKKFDIIPTKYAEIKKFNKVQFGLGSFNKGTILEILELHDQWNSDKIIRLKKYLQRLINPAQVDTKEEFKIFLEAQDFTGFDKEQKHKGQEWNIINGKIENFLFEKLGIKTTEVDSRINEAGTEVMTEIRDKGQFIFSIKGKNSYEKLKNINVKVFYLNKTAKSNFKKTMGLDAIRYGSIFLYKNGIRIHPYGDEGNDWLETEIRKAQGQKRFLSARELMGRIELFGDQIEIKEVSSRDAGIIKNESYQQLYDYIWEKVLKPLEKFVVQGLNWDNPEKPKNEDEIKIDSLELIKRLSGQTKDENTEIKYNKNLLQIFEKKEIEKTPQLLKNIESINKYVKDKKVKAYVNAQIKSLRGAFKFSEKEKKERERELEIKNKEVLFLSKSVSVETEKITNFNHSIQDYSLSINERILEIKEILKDNMDINSIMECISEISKLNGKIKILSEMITQANFDTSEDELEGDIVAYVKQYLVNIGTHKLKLKFYNDNTQFKTTFKPLELGLILDNFRSNSRKNEATQLHIKFEIQKDKLIIYFADNGKGIDDNEKLSLFKRGISTTGGSGLGLYNIKRMLNDIGGDIQFIGNHFENLAKGACFKVVINGRK